MGWNGSGTFTRSNGTHSGSSTWADDAAAGELITTSRHDTHDEDLATGINACLAKNGENSLTGSLVMTELSDHSASIVASFSQLWTKNDAFQSLKFTNDTGADITISAPAPGIINGLNTSNGTDSDHDIDIAVGSCADSTNAYLINLSSGITKQIDADWAEGTNSGGLASGARAVADTPNASTTYHLFVIAKTDGTVDAGWDTDLSATNLLADAAAYTFYRRIASSLIDASNNITAYIQHGDEFLLSAVVQSVDDTAPGTAANLYAMDVPVGIQARAHIGVNMQYNSVGAQALITSPDQTDTAPGPAAHTVRVASSAVHGNAVMFVRTDTSAQIRYRQSDANPDVKLFTYGWIDARGA